MIEAFSLFPNEFIGVSGGSFDHFQESNAFENPEFPDTSTGIEFGLFPPENSTQNPGLKTQDFPNFTGRTQNFTEFTNKTQDLTNIIDLDLQDSDQAEKTFYLEIGRLKEGELPGPFQYQSGYAIPLKPAIQNLGELEQGTKTLLPSLSEEDKESALQNLAQINILQSLLTSRQAVIVQNGQVEQVPNMLNQAWNAITGFGNWVWNGLKGIGETLWNFANDPIGSLQKAWDWISKNPHQAIDAVIAIASVALIIAAIAGTAGLAAPLFALDIATVANIFAKAAISGQQLDTFDLVTLGLVGIANAGGIARAIKPVIRDSRLLKIQSDLDANIARLGEEGSAGRGKIKQGLERLSGKTKIELPEYISELREMGTKSPAEWAARKARGIDEIRQMSDARRYSMLKELADGLTKNHALKVELPDLKYISKASLDKIYSIKKMLEYYKSTENSRLLLKQMGYEFDEIKSIRFVELPNAGKLVAYHDYSKKEIVVNLLQIGNKTPDEIFFIIHHETMHSANKILIFVEENGKLVKKSVKVSEFTDTHIGSFGGKYVIVTKEGDRIDVGKNQLKDIINYKLMQKVDPARAKYFEDAYKVWVEERDSVKAVIELSKKEKPSAEDIKKVADMLNKNTDQPFIAEWLAVKGKEVENIIPQLRSTIKDEKILIQLDEIEELAKVYETKVMTII